MLGPTLSACPQRKRRTGPTITRMTRAMPRSWSRSTERCCRGPRPPSASSTRGSCWATGCGKGSGQAGTRRSSTSTSIGFGRRRGDCAGHRSDSERADRRSVPALAANDMTDGVHVRLMVTRGPKSTPYQDPRFSAGPATIVMIPEHKVPTTKTIDRGDPPVHRPRPPPAARRSRPQAQQPQQAERHHRLHPGLHGWAPTRR